MIGCAIVAGVGLAYMLLGRPYERSEAPSGDAVMKLLIVAPVVELTRRLVAIPSENPPGGHYAECVALLEAELDRLDLKLHRLTDLILEASVGEGDRAAVLPRPLRRRPGPGPLAVRAVHRG